MDAKIKITDVLNVFDGNMKRGYIDNRDLGRYSDAFVYFTEGSVNYSFPGGELLAEAGNIIFLPKNSRYFMDVLEETRFICVDFSYENLPDVLPLELFRGISPSVKYDFEKLFTVWHKKEPWYIPEVFSITYRIMRTCLNTSARKYSKYDKIHSLAIEYILENYTNEELFAEDIAKSLGISEAHLRRVFKEKAGISPMHYVSYLRLEKAKNLLLNSNCTVSEIASLCGFSDPYYFSREFKNQFGIPPSEYKQKSKEKSRKS